MAEHHDEIEHACRELQAAASSGADLATAYRTLERAVLEHMSQEEEHILPGYEAVEPSDATRIEREHDEIRTLLNRVGLDVEIHCVRAANVEELVDRLREHARHEDTMMYRWAEVHLPHRRKRSFLGAIARSLADLQRVRRRFARTQKIPRETTHHTHE